MYVDQERKARKAPGPQTRFVFNCGTNEYYRDLYKEWDRVLTQVKNVTIARQLFLDCILDALCNNLTERHIADLLSEGEGEQAGPPPEKAEIPEWLK